MIKLIFRIFKIPHEHSWKYCGTADGGLAGTVYLWKCRICGEEDVRF